MMTFREWLLKNYEIDWYTFDESYSTSEGTGKKYWDMYCNEMDELEEMEV